MEILKEHQNIEAMVKENTRRRELMKQFATSSHILQESKVYYQELQNREHVEKVHLFVEAEVTDQQHMYIALKIGDRKWYTISSLANFFERLAQQTYAQYGMSLAFTHSINRFDEDSQDLIRFLKNCFYEERRWYPIRVLWRFLRCIWMSFMSCWGAFHSAIATFR